MKQRAVCFFMTLLLISVLSTLFTLNTAQASSYETTSLTRLDQTNKPLLQTPVTPTLTSTSTNTSTFELTFSDLGYAETSLASPIDREEYAFRLPINWQLQANSFIEFDLSYHYSSLDTSSDLPATFGDLSITVDDQTAEIFAIEEPNLDHYRLRVPISPSLLDTLKQGAHTIEITFDAGFFCEIPHNATLIIHPTSYLSLNYSPSPLTLDLSIYPLPFYQRSFEPDEVIFGLPTQPSPAEAAGIVSLAAKLGDLTENRMVISATADLDLVNLLDSSTSTFDQHLFVIGQPQNNRLLPLLNQLTELPIALHERQMGLSTQGPTIISPNQIFTYTFRVTNTTNKPATLALLDTLPTLTEFVDCQPQCLEDKVNSSLTWTEDSFAPAEAKSFSLVLKATEALTNPYLENTVTLVEAELGPINGDSLASQVSLTDINTGEQQTSATNEGEYFFAFNGRAVAESDGIIQEIVSPWHEDRAILIVTGLNEEAIRKASWAMSSEAGFPGMIGPVALVQDAFPPETDEVILPNPEMTFRDLGYNDKFVRGRFSQKITYRFFLPLGWQLTDKAMLDLFFTHAEFAEKTSAGFTVIFNGTPIATVVLNEETALSGSRQINLPASVARPGEENGLIIQFIPSGGGEDCEQPDPFKDFWLVIKSDSKLFLDHTQETENRLDLGLYPYPFNNSSSLIDLLFALPSTPTIPEWENTLRLAASLGNSAGGHTILPAVTLGNGFLEKSLADYHIIAIGRPSSNPLILQANSVLPQPFLPNSDQIQQQIDNIIFRLPPDIALGYLQLVPSSWNLEQVFLAVTGTTDQGVTWAAQVLSSGRFRQLNGDLALIRDSTINNIDTRKTVEEGVAVAVATAAPQLTKTTAITEPLPLPTQSTTLTSVTSIDTEAAEVLPITVGSNSPIWLIPFTVTAIIIAVAIFVIAFMQSKR